MDFFILRVVGGVSGDYARIAVRPSTDAGEFQGGTIFVKRDGSSWHRLLAGTAFNASDLQASGIPQALWTDPLEEVENNVTNDDRQSLMNYFVTRSDMTAADVNVTFLGTEGDYARMEVGPPLDPHLFQPAILFLQ